jgi:hypothetical protein
MLGKRERQFTLMDIGFGERIPEDSYWHKMRTWATKNISEGDFALLFSKYGRPSVSPVYTFIGMLVQLEKNYSDRELEGETRFDDRVKYAITANHSFEGIDAVTLHDHRKRFFESEIGLQILANTIAKAKEVGLFSEENLHVVDSFMVWGACAKQDTYTLIYQGIKLVLRFAGFHELTAKAKAVLKRDDYETAQPKPKIVWEDEVEKNKLLSSLVHDALTLVDCLRKENPLAPDLATVCDLLEKVARQDVQIHDDGRVEMVNGTAPDRIISINDSEMRHGRKTTSQKSDGYKAEIITGGKQARIVMDVAVEAANVPDGDHLGTLIDHVVAIESAINAGPASENSKAGEDSGITIHGDTAYSIWEEIEKREQQGIHFCVKVASAVNAQGLYTKEQFQINLGKGEVTCPGGYTEKFEPKTIIEQRKKTVVEFSAATCNQCPLKAECIKSDAGRKISLHPYEDRLQKQREHQKTPEFKMEYAKRSNGERTIAHLTGHGGRIARYIGKAKVKWQLIMVAINHNIKTAMTYKFQAA